MPRPRRTAAEKPEGHYADISKPAGRKRGAAAGPSEAGPSKRRGKKAEDTKMKGTDDESEEDPDLPLGLSTRSFTNDELARDLGTSYINLVAPAPDRPKRQKRWTQPASKSPIDKLEDTPKGWNMNEPDLDPDDLNAHIQRCHERIEDRIMADLFQHKLEDLLEKKKERDAMMASEPGLSWPVVERLDTLERILEWLRKDDEFELIPSVESIIEKYRSEGLQWVPTLITYWSYGRQLSQPRPFRWEEFEHLSEQFGGQKGFWVEGLHEPKETNQMAHNLVFSANRALSSSGHNWINISIRAPGHVFPNTLDLLDDTGSSFMQITRRDLNRLATMNGVPGVHPPVMCIARLKLADGTDSYMHIMRLEVNIFDPATRSFTLPRYEKVQVAISPDTTGLGQRIGGPWLRHRFFTSTIPNGFTHEVYASDDAGYYNFLPPKHNPHVEIGLPLHANPLPAHTVPFPP